MTYPSIGIDIDGCITDFPIFFQILSSTWPGKVYVITLRSNYKMTEDYLKKNNIRFDQLFCVNSFEEKGEIIKREGITAFYDDQPEILKTITPNCTCMLVRNEGNFSFDNKRFYMSTRTCEII